MFVTTDIKTIEGGLFQGVLLLKDDCFDRKMMKYEIKNHPKEDIKILIWFVYTEIFWLLFNLRNKNIKNFRIQDDVI